MDIYQACFDAVAKRQAAVEPLTPEAERIRQELIEELRERETV